MKLFSGCRIEIEYKKNQVEVIIFGGQVIKQEDRIFIEFEFFQFEVLMLFFQSDVDDEYVQSDFIKIEQNGNNGVFQQIFIFLVVVLGIEMLFSVVVNY